MVNKAECSKKFKKLCDWTIATRKKEVRLAKEFSKLWANYSVINDLISEKTKELNTANGVLQRKKKNIATLKELEEERQKELENLKEQIKDLEGKIEAIKINDSEESEENKSLKLQLLHQSVLKTCTKTYFSDKNPHMIQGFTANEEASKVILFELDPARLTEEQIQNALWENCYQCSSYTKEWAELFAEEPHVDGDS